jgi:hypothetical protein
MEGSPPFAAGFRTGRHYSGFRPGYGRAYGYLGYGWLRRMRAQHTVWTTLAQMLLTLPVDVRQAQAAY